MLQDSHGHWLQVVDLLLARSLHPFNDTVEFRRFNWQNVKDETAFLALGFKDTLKLTTAVNLDGSHGIRKTFDHGV